MSFSTPASRLQWISSMTLKQPETAPLRQSSIICTIGPGVNSVEKMTELRKAGMNVVRMNFSHGSHEYHKSVIDNVRESFRVNPFGRCPAIALDTKGPEIRTGMVKNDGSATFKAGDVITISCDDKHLNECSDKLLYIDYHGIASLPIGSTILVEDGNISFTVVEKIDSKTIRAKAVNSHVLTSRKNVNLPGVPVDLPALSEKDKLDLLFGVENKVDMVFASFIRSDQDVFSIRATLGERGKHIKIISKIENLQGIDNFDAILAASDGIMVARGDLGMEIPLEQVFVAQKMMIAKCNVAGKPVICATQMLESMTFNARPTRAEVSDVANAILDGADCVMLSGETAKGKYPLEAVSTMHRVCVQAESVLCHHSLFHDIREISPKPLDTAESIACAAVSATLEQGNIAAIFVLTTSGDSARLVSKYRPAVPIIAITKNEHVARQCHLSRGVFPLISKIPSDCSTLRIWQDNVDQRIAAAVSQAISDNLIKRGSKIIAIQGWRGGSGKTNNMRILDADSFLNQPCSA